MPAQIEEIVIRAHPRQAQNIGEHFARDLLLRGPRRTPAHQCREIRSRQRVTVHLPVRRQRQSIQHHGHSRDHVTRQHLRHRRPHPVRALPGGEHEITDEPRLPRLIGTHRGRRVDHPGHPPQRGLDLPKLDTVPAHLHLMITAVHELKLPIRAAHHPVTGPVHARPRRPERISHKNRRRPAGVPHVPQPYPSPAHIQFPRHPGRNRGQPVSQHIQPRIPHRIPDRDPRPTGQVILPDHRMCHIIRTLRRPIRIHQRNPGKIRKPAGTQIRRQRLTRHHKPPQRRKRTRPARRIPVIQRRPQHRRHNLKHRHTLARHQRKQRPRIRGDIMAHHPDPPAASSTASICHTETSNVSGAFCTTQSALDSPRSSTFASK